MRICYVLLTHIKYKVGGAELMTSYLAEELKNRGISTCFINGDFGQPELEYIKGIPAYKTSSLWRDHTLIFLPFYYLYSKYDLYKVMKKIDADIYHERCAGTLSFYTMLFSKILNKKSVFTAAHSVDCGHVNLLYDYALPRFDRRIVLSYDMQSLMKKNFGVDSTVIYNGHPLPENVSIDEKEDIVLWAGRFTDTKQPQLFVKISELLSDTKLRFILLAPNNMSDLQRRIITMSGNIDNLTVLTDIGIGEDVNYYKKAKFFVNTSRAEGFPNTYIRSWLRYVPTFSLGIDPDNIIQKNRIGYVAESPEALADVIRGFYEDEQQWKETAIRARKYAEKNHNIKTVAEKHIELYKGLINS